MSKTNAGILALTRTVPGRLKLLQLVTSTAAIGVMSFIFDSAHGNTGSYNDKTNYGTVCGAFGITVISIVATVIQLEQKFKAWKLLDAQLHTVAGVSLLLGWILFLYRVSDLGHFDAEIKEEYPQWYTAACSVLVLEAFIIPLYFIMPYLKTKDNSIENKSYLSAQQLPPTTFWNNQQQKVPQMQQASDYSNIMEQQQNSNLQQPKLYCNYEVVPKPMETQGIHGYEELQLPSRQIRLQLRDEVIIKY